ncbi:MAG: polysaccharide deacetylase family protein [Hyphomicrobiaceae bacterium]|nr:polysaccharide deacetylase family protein [Hyphomicrobiaceae bacterium]
MRATAAVGMAALLLCLWPDGSARSAPAKCTARDAIGVSRTVEIDTSSGPRFGNLQYKDIDFLREGEVVLTFDDGPMRRHTLAVLDALDAHCAKAIFFTVGRMAVADPEMLQEVAMRGHTIGTHTWSHKNLRSLSAAQARAEIELGLSAVQAALGAPVAPFFRFPYLSDPPGMQAFLQQRGIGIFSIDADSYDYRTPSGATVQRNILSQLTERKKGILLFHDIQPSTARALKGLLDELKARGYRVVHLVPKEAATTVAEFDEMAEEVLGKKRLAASGSPPAKRSTAWPLAAGTTADGAGSAAAVSAPPATRPRPPRFGDEEDWKDRVFGN